MDKKDSGKVEIVDSDVRLTMPRTGRKKKALALSIKKWQLIEKYVEKNGVLPETFGEQSCALCQVHIVVDGNCLKCPVCQKTGLQGCHGTPWNKVVNAFKKKDILAAVKKEIKFLKSLGVKEE